jgi:hypothetical protein
MSFGEVLFCIDVESIADHHLATDSVWPVTMRFVQTIVSVRLKHGSVLPCSCENNREGCEKMEVSASKLVDIPAVAIRTLFGDATMERGAEK